MDRNILAFISVLLLIPLAHADTCPTVNDVKSKHLAGWKAYDSDSGKPLNKERAADFVKSVDQFILAEWSKHSKQSSTMHCFYRDKNGSDLEAYLTKDNLVPEHNNKWYRVSGAMQCAAGNKMCSFAHIHRQPTFAKNKASTPRS